MGNDDPQLQAVHRYLDEIDAQALTEEAGLPHSVIAYDPMTESYLEAQRLKDELNKAVGEPGYPPIATWVAMQLTDDNSDPRA